MGDTAVRTVVSDGDTIVYCLERKPVKNLNLRIRRDGSVMVSAGADVPLDEIDAFVRKKSIYIRKSIRKFEELVQYQPQAKQYVSGETFYIQGRGVRLKVLQAEKESVMSDGVYITLTVKDPGNMDRKRRMMNRFLDQQCEDVFGGIIARMYPIFRKYGVAYPTLRIRDMDTRWGSCLSKKGIITLNKRLLEVPGNCIEYVIMHEYCHFLYPNHSKAFYDFLTVQMPDWKERKRVLEKEITSAHGAVSRY